MLDFSSQDYSSFIMVTLAQVYGNNPDFVGLKYLLVRGAS